MVTQAAVRALISENHTYEEAARRLDINPGLAYLAATGLPSDSTDGLAPEDLDRPGLLVSAQHLSNPRTELADRAAHIRAFLSARARSDAQMQSAERSA